jgi:hypothetical protein
LGPDLDDRLERIFAVLSLPPLEDFSAPGPCVARSAADLLMVSTSYETFRELRLSGLSDKQLTTTLQESARTVLLR